MKTETTPSDNVDRLEARIARLERSAARWRWVGVSAILVGIAAASMAAAGRFPKNLVAERFTLVDKKGMERGALFVDDDGPVIALKNLGGKTIAVLAGKSEGAELTLLNANESLATRLESKKEGGRFFIANSMGKTVVAAAPNTAGMGTVVVSNAEGKRCLNFTALKTGGGMLVYDDKQKPNVVIMSKDSKGSVYAYDDKGKVIGTLDRD